MSDGGQVSVEMFRCIIMAGPNAVGESHEATSHVSHKDQSFRSVYMFVPISALAGNIHENIRLTTSDSQ